MRRFGFQWQHFRSFPDTGLVRLRPITVVLGANAGGKTSVIAPLLMLKQTHDARDPSVRLKTKGRLFNAGTYANLIHNHEKERRLGLMLRFGPTAAVPKPSQAADGLPSSLELLYQQDEADDTPALLSFVVRDAHDRVMLRRNRMGNGQYSVEAFDLPDDAAGWSSAIRASQPSGFLFTSDDVFAHFYRRAAEAVRATADKEGESKSESPFEVTVGQRQQLYINIVTFVANQVQRLLDETSYIGPLRDRPRRTYELSGEPPFSVGPAGEYAPEILYRNREPGFRQQVDAWVQHFEFGDGIEARTLTEGVYNVLLRRGDTSPEISIADTGFGLSQVLPLIVQGFFGSGNSLIVAEQPEIHLNPRLQARLADLFAAIAQRGLGVLVETHSEHLVLRLRRLVAEGQLKSNDLALYFVEREGTVSTLREIPIDGKGQVERDAWPRGFFEDAFAESLALSLAQARP